MAIEININFLIFLLKISYDNFLIAKMLVFLVERHLKSFSKKEKKKKKCLDF